MTSLDVQIPIIQNLDITKISSIAGSIQKESTRNHSKTKTVLNNDMNIHVYYNSGNKQKDSNNYHINNKRDHNNKDRDNINNNLSLDQYNSNTSKINSIIPIKNVRISSRNNSLAYLDNEQNNNNNNNNNSRRESETNITHTFNNISLNNHSKNKSKKNIVDIIHNEQSIDRDIPNNLIISKPGETLDKIFGGNFKAIDIYNNEDNVTEIFPKNPKQKDKQRNFDILEADEEEDEIFENMKDNETNDTNDLHELRSFKSAREASEELTRRNKRPLRIPTSQKTRQKYQDSCNAAYDPQVKKKAKGRKCINSHSPMGIRNAVNLNRNQLQTENESYSPYKTSVNNNSSSKGFNSSFISNILSTDTYAQDSLLNANDLGSNIMIDYYKTQSMFRKHSINDFYNPGKNETIINKILDQNLSIQSQHNNHYPNQQQQQQILQKENKFFNQKALIDTKFKNEDEFLIYKYANKFNLYDTSEGNNNQKLTFGINQGQQQKLSNSNIKSIPKRIATPIYDLRQLIINKAKIKLSEQSKNSNNQKIKTVSVSA